MEFLKLDLISNWVIPASWFYHFVLGLNAKRTICITDFIENVSVLTDIYCLVSLSVDQLTCLTFALKILQPEFYIIISLGGKIAH